MVVKHLLPSPCAHCATGLISIRSCALTSEPLAYVWGVHRSDSGVLPIAHVSVFDTRHGKRESKNGSPVWPAFRELRVGTSAQRCETDSPLRKTHRHSLSSTPEKKSCNFVGMKEKAATNANRTEFAFADPASYRVRGNAQFVCNVQQRKQFRNAVSHYSPLCFILACMASAGMRHCLPTL